MASKSRTKSSRKKRNPSQFPQLDLFNIPNLDPMADDSDGSEVDESVLETELEALMSGIAPSKTTGPKLKAKAAIDIEKIVADCLKDIEDDNEDDDDLSTDEDLLRELQLLTTEEETEELETPEIIPKETNSSENNQSESAINNVPGILLERLAMYNEAIASAKKAGDASKVRRYSRALKTIETLLKSAKTGGSINDEDIPPPVKIPKIRSDSEGLTNSSKFENDECFASSNTDLEKAALAAADEAEVPEIFDAPPPPSTISEALQQRLEKYVTTKQAADTEGNSGKVRRLARIIKQYQKAITDYKSGKSVDFSELPSPPGFGPIPIDSDKPSMPTPCVIKPSEYGEPDPQKKC